jgi:hypothetical protein
MKQENKIAIGIAGTVVALALLGFIFRKKIRNLFLGTTWFDENLSWYKDLKTKSIVEALHPKAVNRFKDFLSRVEKELGLKVIATSGYRTWERQAELKKENSSNASAGSSLHNYGLALDVNVLDKNNKPLLKKASSKAEWEKSGIIRVAKDMGFKWGGDFKSYHDPVHFYLDFAPIEELKKNYLAGKRDSKGYVKL